MTRKHNRIRICSQSVEEQDRANVRPIVLVPKVTCLYPCEAGQGGHHLMEAGNIKMCFGDGTVIRRMFRYRYVLYIHTEYSTYILCVRKASI